MLRNVVLAITAILAFPPPEARSEERPKTLLTRVAEWQYPDSHITGATMSDAATVDEKGRRTVPSVHCKAVLTTKDPIDTVLGYYRSKLDRKANHKKDAEPAIVSPRNSGRSVTFHSDSHGRPVVIHVIAINEDRISTTLVISRAQGESKTHIAWSQYEKFNVNP